MSDETERNAAEPASHDVHASPRPSGRGSNDAAASPAPAPPTGWLSRVLRALVALAILAAGAGASYYYLTTKPAAQRRPSDPQATLVEIQRVEPGAETVIVRAMGAVVPERVIQLAPRVGGEIVEVSPDFAPGGRFRAGEVMARIDPKDFDLAVRTATTEVQRQSALADQRAAEAAQRASDCVRAESDLAMEMGYQSVARREYELLGQAIEDGDEALVLRRPQLETAQATLASAKAAQEAAEGAARAAQAARDAADIALQKAALDLERTTIRAPFNAVVDTRHVNLGSQAAIGTPLATLVGTDAYWVEVSVPVDQLKWIRIPRTEGEAGSPARITNEAAWGADVYRTGTVIRLRSALEEQGRMARVLVSAPDPLGLANGTGATPPMIIGSYVHVEIEGEDLAGVIALDRNLLRDGDHVWVMDDAGKLQIRPVEVAHRGRNRVLVSGGLEPGERVVTTDLAAAVEGMRLRTETAGPAPAAASPDDRESPRPSGRGSNGIDAPAAAEASAAPGDASEGRSP